MTTAIATATRALVVGTHALIEEGVEFATLGLAIVDEQHRFGVQQRLALEAEGISSAHQLTMSATPIPRTLAMSYYADLDVSRHRRTAAGPHAGADQARRRGAARRGDRPRARRLRRRTPGVLGVPADRGDRGAGNCKTGAGNLRSG